VAASKYSAFSSVFPPTSTFAPVPANVSGITRSCRSRTAEIASLPTGSPRTGAVRSRTPAGETWILAGPKLASRSSLRLSCSTRRGTLLDPPATTTTTG